MVVSFQATTDLSKAQKRKLSQVVHTYYVS